MITIQRGNDISVQWTIKDLSGSAVDFSGCDISFAVRSKIKGAFPVTPTSTTSGVIRANVPGNTLPVGHFYLDVEWNKTISGRKVYWRARTEELIEVTNKADNFKQTVTITADTAIITQGYVPDYSNFLNKNELAQETGSSTTTAMSQAAVTNKLTELGEISKDFANISTPILSDYIVNRDGSVEAQDEEKNITITDNSYYDDNGEIKNNENYVCGEFVIDNSSYKYVKLKFAAPLHYAAKSFFANEDGFILQYIGCYGSEINYIIPQGATKVCVSSRKISDSEVTGVPQPTYQMNNPYVSKFAKEESLINSEQYKREIYLVNKSPTELDIDLQDNKYFDGEFVEQSSNNFNCFKIDISQYIGSYLILDAFCFGNSYAARSAITDENNKVVRYVSNEGILPKYIYIPLNSKYLYVSNRKYIDVSVNIATGSAVRSVNKPTLYLAHGTPTLLDTRHFTELKRKNSNKYFHFSLDDFKDAISDIVTNANTYNSIFDNSTFAKLREWHDKYGIVISLYLQRTMSDVPSKFKKDFIYNKDWLKFGYHGNGSSWETATYENGKQWWNDFVDGIMASIGSYDVIDRVPRNDYFHGTEESCKGERDANCGCLGFLGCDDWGYNAATRKTNYYLTDEQSKYLDIRDRFYDSENQLCIFKTDFRLEQIQERWGDVNSCLDYYNSAEGSMQAFDMIVFSHEWNFLQFVSDAETIFEWALNNGYRFDYPMNVLLR